MFFSGHLLQDCLQSFPCCQKIKQTLSKEDSNSNSKRQTSYTNNRSPTHSLNTWREMSHSKSTSFIPIPTWDRPQGRQGGACSPVTVFGKVVAWHLCQSRAPSWYQGTTKMAMRQKVPPCLLSCAAVCKLFSESYLGFGQQIRKAWHQ